MKDKVSFSKTYSCLDEECKFVIDSAISTIERGTEEMPLTRKTIKFKDLQIEDGNENRVTGWISNRELDWSGDIMIPEGVILEVYQRNPTVLLNHDTTKIIGKCVNLQVEEYGIKATMEFAPIDEAQDVKKLAKGGFLNCFSVGFIPVDFVKSNEKRFKAEEAIIKSKYPEYQGGANRIIKQFVLLEYSIVSQPDNSKCVITQKQIQDMEIKTHTLETLKLKCTDCNEAKEDFNEKIQSYSKTIDNCDKDLINEAKERTKVKEDVVDTKNSTDNKRQEDSAKVEMVSFDITVIKTPEQKRKEKNDKEIEKTRLINETLAKIESRKNTLKKLCDDYTKKGVLLRY